MTIWFGVRFSARGRGGILGFTKPCSNWQVADVLNYQKANKGYAAILLEQNISEHYQNAICYLHFIRLV